MLNGEFLAFHLNNKEGVAQRHSILLIPPSLAGDQMAGCRYPVTGQKAWYPILRQRPDLFVS